eukprot:403335147
MVIFNTTQMIQYWEKMAVVHIKLEVTTLKEEIQLIQFQKDLLGGCGSGLTGLISERLAVDYSKKVSIHNTLFPSFSAHDQEVQAPNNAILGLFDILAAGQDLIMQLFTNKALCENIKTLEK